jgi:hypothetical protein
MKKRPSNFLKILKALKKKCAPTHSSINIFNSNIQQKPTMCSKKHIQKENWNVTPEKPP